VNKDLADQLIMILKKKGRTIYSYVNNVMEYAVKARELGVNLRDIVNEYQYYMYAFQNNFILIPFEIFIHALKINLAADHDGILQEFHSFGKWYANLTKMKYKNILKMENFVGFFFDVIFSKVLNISVRATILNNKKQKNSLKSSLSIIIYPHSNLISKDILICYYHFFRGFFEMHGFKEDRKEIKNSVITFEISRHIDMNDYQEIQQEYLQKKKRSRTKKDPYERKILAVSKDLEEKILPLIKEQRMTLFRFFNENILQSALLAEQYDVPLGTILKEYQGFQTLRGMGFAFVPAPIFFSITKLAAKKPTWENTWKKRGISSGKLLVARLKNPDLSQLVNIFQMIFYRGSSNEMNLEIVSTPSEMHNYELRIYGTTLSEDLTAGFGAFFEGIFEVIGYKTLSKKNSYGICVLHLQEKHDQN